MTRRIQVGAWACRVAIMRGAAWVTRDRADVLARVDLRTGHRREIAVGASPFDVIAAAGSIWTTSYDSGAITSIDPGRGAIVRVFNDGANPAGLAWCAGRVWVGHGRSATWLTSIDPTTLRIRRVPVGAATPGWPTCIGGVIWVTTPDSVLRLDPRIGKRLSQLEIGETLADVAMAPDGLAWVTDKQHSVVHRVTADGSAVVDSFPAGPGAYALTRTGGSMWVTSFAGSDVRRYEAR